MFWDKSYTASPNIENLLQKENVTVEEFLDDDDILQECKNQKALVQYFTRPDIIKRLIELTITEPPEDVSITQRFKHANMACEILTFGLPSLDEKLVEDDEILGTLYSYLEKEPPLNPLLSSFFNKTFCMLISKKVETDWFLYQKICFQLLEFIKSRGNFLDLIFKHFATPVIMDLLLQIIEEVQGSLKKDLYEWFTNEKLVERLIEILGKPKESEKHKNISEFLCDLIRYCRSIRQSDQQENDAFEQIFPDGGNPLLMSIENHKTISQLIDVMLLSDVQETTVVAGVKILLTLADESIVDEPASDLALQLIMDKEKDNHERVISIIVDVIEPKINNFHSLLLKTPQKNEYTEMHSDLPPPFGLTRLQICSLFTIIIRIGNSRLIDAICKTDLLNTLLKLFKEYCWNNFLHTEVEKCLRYVFSNNNKQNINNNENNIKKEELTITQKDEPTKQENQHNDDKLDKKTNDQFNYEEKSNGDIVENSDNVKPTTLQTYAIVDCKIIPKLIDCWMLNSNTRSTTKGRRLGYMGHLIKIFETIKKSLNESEKLGALIEKNLTEEELINWRLIIDKDDGELIKELNTQNRMLAGCNAYVNSSLFKEFRVGNTAAQFFNEFSANLSDLVEAEDFLEPFEFEQSDPMYSDLFMTKMHLFKDEFVVCVEKDKKKSDWGLESGNNTSEVGIDSDGWSNSNNEFFADFDSHFNDFDLGLNNGASITTSSLKSKLKECLAMMSDSKNNIIEQDKNDQNSSDSNANFEKLCDQKVSLFDDDDNFDFNNTKENAEKIIESIVSDDVDDDNDENNDSVISSNIIQTEKSGDIVGGNNGDGSFGDIKNENVDDNIKMQTDDDDEFTNKNGGTNEKKIINSFNKVHVDNLDKMKSIHISASNGPTSDDDVDTSSPNRHNCLNTERDSKQIENESSSTIDDIEKDIKLSSSTLALNNTDNKQITKVDDGGCEDDNATATATTIAATTTPMVVADGSS